MSNELESAGRLLGAPSGYQNVNIWKRKPIGSLPKSGTAATDTSPPKPDRRQSSTFFVDQPAFDANMNDRELLGLCIGSPNDPVLARSGHSS
jgi:hypothetical protein